MAIKIIRKSSDTFRIECEGCDAIFEYGFNNLENFAIRCPCCNYWNDHRMRIKTPVKSEDMDMVEVVRCMDCKHFRDGGADGQYCDYHTGNAGDYCDYACWVAKNDYCSYGERKENV